jgi:adenylosuccinate synthase
VTLLDVLDAFDTVCICTGYRSGGRPLGGVPPSVAGTIEPVFETLDGWGTDTTGIRQWDALPDAARRYLARIEEIVGAEVALAGVGPERGQSLVRPGSWLARRLARTP